MSNRLRGKRALVIGASSGIGRAIAKRYAAEGARVAIAARSIETLEEVAANTSDNNEMVPITCDVQETSSIEMAVETVLEEFGGLDIVVNSAGVISRADMISESDENMEWVVDVNLLGMMRVARVVLPELIESGGTFIPVSSQLGKVGVEGASVYCGTKGGINNLTRQLAIEYADEGVRVNALAPGVIKTPMNESVRMNDDEWETEKADEIPMGRLGDPSEVAEPAVFLGSDESSYMTGHVLVIDGGYVAE